jgi:hypothetical protein
MPPRPAPIPSDDAAILERFAAWFPRDDLIAVSGAGALASRFDSLGPQRPATCGAYALSYLLPALGFTSRDGIDLAAEDYLAHLAAVIVEADEVAPSEDVSRRVGAGEISADEALSRFGQVWYRFPVRASSDPVESGTSPTGIARAVALATDASLGCLPIPGRTAAGDVALDPTRWDALLAILADRVEAWHWHAILNYEVNHILSPTDLAYRVENLRAPDADRRIRRDDWGVGHFAGVLGLWRRHVDARWWLVLLDTYKERGFAGYQPQPAELVRQAIVRTDGRGGGVLLLVPSTLLPDAAEAIRGLGVELRMWSNGSPEPDDWAWQPPR